MSVLSTSAADVDASPGDTTAWSHGASQRQMGDINEYICATAPPRDLLTEGICKGIRIRFFFFFFAAQRDCILIKCARRSRQMNDASLCAQGPSSALRLCRRKLPPPGPLGLIALLLSPLISSLHSPSLFSCFWPILSSECSRYHQLSEALTPWPPAPRGPYCCCTAFVLTPYRGSSI